MANVVIHSNLETILKATEEQLAKAGETIGGIAETHAKENIRNNGSIRTSTLFKSIDHRYDASTHTIVIGTNVEYAPFVELGHTQEPGRFVPAIGKRLVRDWVPPKPFLRPAIEDHIDEYKEVLQTELST